MASSSTPLLSRPLAPPAVASEAAGHAASQRHVLPRALGRNLGAAWELTKPRVTRTVLATTFLGAISAPGPLEGQTLACTLLGTSLVVGAANAINMVMEADTDALMERTRTRPLPRGALTPRAASWFGWGLCAAGLGVLGAWTSWLATLLALSALLIYVAAYTPLKRRTPLALYVGAVPGAIPPLIGWAGVTSELGLQACSLFVILYAWQIPHFHAISIYRCQEYAVAKIKVLPVVRGVERTKLAIVFSALLLIPASLTPYLLGMGGVLYLVSALVSSALFLLLAMAGMHDTDARRWARRLFLASVPHLLLLYTVLAALSA